MTSFTLKISLILLLTVCHTVNMLLVQRIRYCINKQSPNLYIFLFYSHHYCLLDIVLIL